MFPSLCLLCFLPAVLTFLSFLFWATQWMWLTSLFQGHFEMYVGFVFWLLHWLGSIIGLPCVYGGGRHAKRSAVHGTVPILEHRPVKMIVNPSSPSAQNIGPCLTPVFLWLIFFINLPLLLLAVAFPPFLRLLGICTTCLKGKTSSSIYHL